MASPSPDHFQQFIPAICAGFGLFLTGALNLLLIRRGIAIRAFATALALTVAIAAADALEQPGVTVPTVRLLAFGLIPFLLLGSRALAMRGAATITAIHRPAIRFALLTAAGIGTAIGSIVIFEQADEDAAEASTAELALLESRSPSIPNEQVKAATDCGTRVVLREPQFPHEERALTTAEMRLLEATQLSDRVIRRNSASEQSNCHGWVFTDGHFLLGGEEVEVILKENGYQEVPVPQPGDVVVYRSGGRITHTGLVRYVSEGQPVLIESKWGGLGVFLHETAKSPYGTEYVYYRSRRQGHLLTGIGGSTRKPAANEKSDGIPAASAVE